MGRLSSRSPRTAVAALLLAVGVLLGACAAEVTAPPADGSLATWRSWEPEDGPPQVVILAAHGFNDYSGAFEGFGEYAAMRGVAVHAYDHRGFGANPNAGVWPGIRNLTADLKGAMAVLRERYPDQRIYVLGESMGAAVIAAAMTEPNPPVVDGLIFSAPAVWGGTTMPGLYRAALWVAVRVVPWWELTGAGLPVQASDNIPMLRQLGADPLVIKRTRVAAVNGLVTLMDRAFNAIDYVPGPLLFLTGERDEIVPPSAYRAVRPRMSAEPCTAVDYPEGWHLLLRDLQRQVVWDDILAWTGGEPLPSGLAEPCGTMIAEAAPSQS